MKEEANTFAIIILIFLALLAIAVFLTPLLAMGQELPVDKIGHELITVYKSTPDEIIVITHFPENEDYAHLEPLQKVYVLVKKTPLLTQYRAADLYVVDEWPEPQRKTTGAYFTGQEIFVKWETHGHPPSEDYGGCSLIWHELSHLKGLNHFQIAKQFPNKACATDYGKP